MATARERMVRSAALLIRERGARATAIADVLAHSGAPRGSAYHYFPQGRRQLLGEAIDYAGAYVAGLISGPDDAGAALDTLFDTYREQLLATDFRAGCPVVAVAVEAGDPDAPPDILDRAGAAFAQWTELITGRLRADGVVADRAADLAMLIVTAIEGAIVVARATRDIAPMDQVHRQLRLLLDTERPHHDR
jgi:AcrR family transcriptional regulator